MPDLVTIQCEALPDDAHVVSVRGRESISLPFRYEIGLRIDDESFDMDAAIRARATLAIDRGDDADPYPIHGIIASFEHLRQWQGTAIYRAVLVPKVWNLGQSLHSRLFTDNTVPEIIEAVLKFGGLTADELDLRLQGDYPKKEHVFQWRESNLQFISRWMERLGIYYFFEHGEGHETLVITDVKASHEASRSDGVRYVPLSGDDAMSDDALESFHCVRSALPATVQLADYDYMNPTLAVEGSAPIASSSGLGEVHRYDHNFRNPNEGNKLAQIRAEALLSTEKVYHGKGRVFGLRSGHKFALEEHPRAAFNANYMVVELEQFINQSASDAATKRVLGIERDEELFGTDEYGIIFQAIHADTQYRAPERHRWPRIDGYEEAEVCGETTSQYAQIDDQGRYKVKLHCDESDLIDGSASTWVRMLQPHGGGNEGFHFPLRKGTEVILIFLGGDPDQPVLAGVVPNAHTPSPVTKGNHTLNVIQTGGLNRFELKDDEGTQHVKLSTPPENTHIHMGAPNDEHNLHICTDGDTLTYNGRNWDAFTYGAKYEYVQLDSDLNVDGSEFITVKGIRCENVQQHVSSNYDMDYVLSVVGMHDVWIGDARIDHVEGGDCTENYDQNHLLTVGIDQTIKVGGKLDEEVGGNVKETYKGAMTTDVTGGNYDLTVTGDYNLKAANIDKVWQGWQKGVTAGIWTELVLGIKNENLIGGKIETLLGMKAEATLSVRFALATGMVAEADASVKMETIAAKMETIAADIQTIATILTTGSIDLDLTGLKIM